MRPLLHQSSFIREANLCTDILAAWIVAVGGLKMETEEQVRFFKQLDSLADLHGISSPSTCRVPA